MVETLAVKGMTCNHCKMRVETAAKSLAGVGNAEVSLSDATLTVDYDDGKLSLEDIKTAIIDTGYEPG